MANNTLIGALRAEATLESGKFVDGAKKIRQESKKTEVQVKSSFSAMGTAVKGFGGALTAGLSIGLLGGLAKKALDFAAAIKTTASQVGVTTKELQEFSYAASQVGVKQADADKALERLNVSMGKAAAKSKEMVKAFASVGVTVQDIKTKSKTEIFGQIADQMIKQGGAAKNAAAANLIFGESASKLNPLLDKGSQGINELAAAANRLGVVLSDHQIQQADETAQKLEDVKRVLAAQISGVVADNASSILSLANALGHLTSSIVNFLGSNPQAALAILGGLAGSRFGLPGAAAGAIGGAVLGRDLQGQVNQRNLQGDTGLLRHNLQQQIAGLKKKRASGQPVTQGELKRLQTLTDKLNTATGRGPSSFSPGLDIPEFLASPGPKARKGRTPRGPRDRSDDVSFQFDQELRRAQMDTLRAQQSLATNADERARLSLVLLDLQKEDQEAELKNRVRRAERDFAEGKIDAQTLEKVKVQAEALRAQYKDTDALERQAIADNLAADKARDAVELSQSAYDLRLEQLQNEAGLAETASERREVELRILALMKEQEKARLDAVIADTQSSDLAKQQAQQRLDSLDKIYAGREDNVRQGTRSPMEDYLASLPTTAAKAQEALERLEVQGFEGLIDAAVALTEGFDNAKDALLNTLKQFLQGVLRMQLQQGLGSLLKSGAGGILGNLFGGGTSSFDISSTASSNMAALNAIPMNIPGYATGGSLRILGNTGTDQNLLSLNGMPIGRVSYGERLNISNDNSGRGTGGRMVNQTFIFPNSDADSFRRSEGQVARAARRRIGG